MSNWLYAMFKSSLCFHRTLVLAVFLLAWFPHAVAEEVVAEFEGDSSGVTAEFEVEAPWLLDWRVTTRGRYEAGIEVSLEEAGTSLYKGRVLETRSPGNGVRLFEEGGSFYFRVDSSFANWTLKVVELTEAEAADYTPKSSAPLER